MTNIKAELVVQGMVLTMAIFANSATAVYAEAPPAGAIVSADAIKAQSHALATLIISQIHALPADITRSEDYEAAIVLAIAQTSSNQNVQVNALAFVLGVSGLPTNAYSALRRVVVAAKAGRLTGTAALDGSDAGFRPSSSFSAPVVDMGGGSVNYSTP